LDDALFYLLVADAMLVVHVLFVCFVVLGLLLIFIGKWRAWQWVRHFWFRVIHLLAIAIVVLQSWLGAICPLTLWEMELRALAGDTVYSGSFIAHWLGELLYYHAPDWAFVILYTAFGSLVLLSWYWIRPRR
jgi:glucan phosphoethanolaminetransferase (alkaline phosphatase superfamily)